MAEVAGLNPAEVRKLKSKDAVVVRITSQNDEKGHKNIRSLWSIVLMVAKLCLLPGCVTGLDWGRNFTN